MAKPPVSAPGTVLLPFANGAVSRTEGLINRPANCAGRAVSCRFAARRQTSGQQPLRTVRRPGCRLAPLDDDEARDERREAAGRDGARDERNAASGLSVYECTGFSVQMHGLQCPNAMTSVSGCTGFGVQTHAWIDGRQVVRYSDPLPERCARRCSDRGAEGIRLLFD